MSMLKDLETDMQEESKKESLQHYWCSVYRFPEKIRKLNEDAYTPQVVSIGPFHHGKKEVQMMERQKLRYLKSFCEKNGKSLSELVRLIEEYEVKIRMTYSETFDNLCSAEFVRIITLDSIFVLELFLSGNYGFLADIFSDNQWVLDAVRRDLLLLENQLPYLFLDKIYEEVYRAPKPSLFENVCEFFKEHTDTDHVESYQGFRHFTDVIRSFYKPRPLIQICPPNRSVNIHSASKLHEAGVKFKKTESGRTLFDVDVDFNQGVLQMAKIQVEEKTESLLRNLMALEQWLYPSDTYICHYVSLLDHLIDATNDVELLVKADILSHRLGSSDEVVSLVNKLCINIETSKDIFSHRLGSSNALVSLVNKLCINIKTSGETSQGCSNQKGLYEKLNEYYDKPLHKWKAIFIHEYFNTPFKIASTSTAVIFLVLTLIQTIFAIVKI